MSARAEALFIAAVAFLSFACLSPQLSINDQIVTRLGLTLAIIEQGSLTIERVAGRTVDKAEIGGRFYSDKAPGLSLIAVPPVAAARAVFQGLGLPSESADPIAFERYNWIATVATNGVAVSMATAMLLLAALRLGASRAGARLAALAFAFATPMLGWATAFFAHALSASLLLAIFALGTAAFAGERRFLSGRGFALGAIAGLLMGLGLCVDFTTAPALAAGALVFLWLGGRPGARAFAGMAGGLLIGGLLGLLPLLVYNQLAFGSPFTLGYSGVKAFPGMQQGLFGITWPDLAVAAELVVGEYRGLLPLAPILAVAPIGLERMLEKPGARLAALIIAFVVLSFFWINASYVYWKGGNTTGPRFLVPVIPFLCLALAFCWPRYAWLRAIVILLLSLSAALSLLTAAVSMLTPEPILRPVRDFVVPRLLSGEGTTELLVVAVLWCAAGLLLWRRLRLRPEAAAPS